MVRPHPLESIKRLRAMTDSVIVAFSRGRDSLVTLDLCKKHFARVEAFFCAMVPGLEFEERSLRYAERRWNTKIHRKPHWFLSAWMKAGAYRIPTDFTRNLPSMSERDIFDHMRDVTGLEWIVTGRKADDSLWRRSMLAGKPDGIFEKRKEAMPLAWWSNQSVGNYLKRNHIPLPADYRHGAGSMGDLSCESLRIMQAHFPGDYAKVERAFPYIGAELARAKFRKDWATEGHPIPVSHDGPDAPPGIEESAVQPAGD